jgi:RNA polymerase sigma-70 factor (ECF subfamily)
MSKNNDTEERQRIRRILDGRSDEYGYFVKTYSTQVLDFVSRMVGDASDAEELAQDTFVKAFRSLASFGFQSSFATWLCRIAYHETLNHLRRQHPHTIDIDDMPIADGEDEAEECDARIDLLEETIGLLPPDEQQLLHLYYYEDRPLREIAYIMDVEQGALATRLHRIRKKLMTMMKQKEHERTE